DLLLQRDGLVARERRGRGCDGLDDAAFLVEQAAVLSGDAGEPVDRAALDEQDHEASHRLGHALRERLVDEADTVIERPGGITEHGQDLLAAQHVRGQVETVAMGVEGVVARGELDCRLGVPVRGGRRSLRHQAPEPLPDEERGAGSARNSSTRRRWRWSVMVSRTTRPAAWSASSATS